VTGAGRQEHLKDFSIGITHRKSAILLTTNH